MNQNRIWYFPLEPLESRYTTQLSNWMTSALKEAGADVFIVSGETNDIEIKRGEVLDYLGRSQYALSQCQKFLKLIDAGEVWAGDTIYLQDFWTPGIEGVFYTLDLLGIPVRVYAMLHAQSVDEYDFTYPLRHWMRNAELSIDRHLSGMFVASTVHKEQLRAAGFTAPIHVVGLPIDTDSVRELARPQANRKRQVIYTSRLDREKNPHFMLAVANEFLAEHKDWSWVITTSAKSLRSNDPKILQEIERFRFKEPRFVVNTGLSKQEYYGELAHSAIQFNSALQDYVSWTLLEACALGCDIVYPDFRSFKECVPSSRRYQAFDIDSAHEVLARAMRKREWHELIAERNDIGRRVAARITVHGSAHEVNIWHEAERLIGELA